MDEKKYTQFPNDILMALISYGLNATQLSVAMYVVRQTYGFHKPYGDRISVKRMAKEIGKSRQYTMAAVNDLEKLGILERYYEGPETRTGIKTMRIASPSCWDKNLDQT